MFLFKEIYLGEDPLNLTVTGKQLQLGSVLNSATRHRKC